MEYYVNTGKQILTTKRMSSMRELELPDEKMMEVYFYRESIAIAEIEGYKPKPYEQPVKRNVWNEIKKEVSKKTGLEPMNETLALHISPEAKLPCIIIFPVGVK